jgi:hypothetical protein
MTQNGTEAQEKVPSLDVYHISEKEDGKHVWTKVGVALINQDGSINVFLDALPVDGKLQIREGRK